MRLSKADRQTTRASGKVDIDLFAEHVGAAYEEADHDRRRTDRLLMLLCAELEQARAPLLEDLCAVSGALRQVAVGDRIEDHPLLRLRARLRERLSRKRDGRNSLLQHLRAIGVSCAAGTFGGNLSDSSGTK